MCLVLLKLDVILMCFFWLWCLFKVILIVYVLCVLVSGSNVFLKMWCIVVLVDLLLIFIIMLFKVNWLLVVVLFVLICVIIKLLFCFFI